MLRGNLTSCLRRSLHQILGMRVGEIKSALVPCSDAFGPPRRDRSRGPMRPTAPSSTMRTVLIAAPHGSVLCPSAAKDGF